MWLREAVRLLSLAAVCALDAGAGPIARAGDVANPHGGASYGAWIARDAGKRVVPARILQVARANRVIPRTGAALMIGVTDRA
jgi:hypothetical protein